jgi:hypothetical protein
MDSQLIGAQFLPHASQSFRRESCRGDSLHFRFLKMGRCPTLAPHCVWCSAGEDRGVALKFFFCDGLTWDDVFDWHDWNFTALKPLSRLPLATLRVRCPPRWEKLIPPETKVALLWTITTAIAQPAPFPLGKGGEIGPCSSPPQSLSPILSNPNHCLDFYVEFFVALFLRRRYSRPIRNTKAASKKVSNTNPSEN